MAELFDSLSAARVLRTFVRHLVAFCSRPEGASHVTSGSYMRLTVPISVYNFVIIALTVLEKCWTLIYASGSDPYAVQQS